MSDETTLNDAVKEAMAKQKCCCLEPGSAAALCYEHPWTKWNFTRDECDHTNKKEHHMINETEPKTATVEVVEVTIDLSRLPAETVLGYLTVRQGNESQEIPLTLEEVQDSIIEQVKKDLREAGIVL